MLEWILSNWDLLLGILSAASSIVFGVIFYIVRFKRLKNAKTQAERDAIIEELKSHTYGLVAVAEQMFADIPKSGASKLLYVLNHIQKLCEDQNIEYDAAVWEEFVNDIIGRSNDVITAKETEKAISGYIEKVKEEIPYFMTDADKLFEVIPDSAAYKIEYILKLVAKACAKYAIDTYDMYDWRGYITGLYNEKIGA